MLFAAYAAYYVKAQQPTYFSNTIPLSLRLCQWTANAIARFAIPASPLEVVYLLPGVAPLRAKSDC